MRFEVDTALRRKHMQRLLLRLPGAMALGMVPSLFDVSQINYRLLGITTGLGLVLILLSIRWRSAWGTALEFQDPRMVFYRGEEKLLAIPSQSLRRVQLKKDAIILEYTLGGPLKFKVIASEGFAPDLWQALCKEAADFGRRAEAKVDGFKAGV